MRIFRKIFRRFAKIENRPERDLPTLPHNMTIRIDDDVASSLLFFTATLDDTIHRSAAQQLLHLTLDTGRLTHPTHRHFKQLIDLEKKFTRRIISDLLSNWWAILHNKNLLTLTEDQKRRFPRPGRQSIFWLSRENLRLAFGIIRLYSFHFQTKAAFDILSLMNICNRKIPNFGYAAAALSQEGLKNLIRMELTSSVIPHLDQYPNCLEGRIGYYFKKRMMEYGIRA